MGDRRRLHCAPAACAVRLTMHTTATTGIQRPRMSDAARHPNYNVGGQHASRGGRGGGSGGRGRGARGSGSGGDGRSAGSGGRGNGRGAQGVFHGAMCTMFRVGFSLKPADQRSCMLNAMVWPRRWPRARAAIVRCAGHVRRRGWRQPRQWWSRARCSRRWQWRRWARCWRRWARQWERSPRCVPCAPCSRSVSPLRQQISGLVC